VPRECQDWRGSRLIVVFRFFCVGAGHRVATNLTASSSGRQPAKIYSGSHGSRRAVDVAVLATTAAEWQLHSSVGDFGPAPATPMQASARYVNVTEEISLELLRRDRASGSHLPVGQS
jgi:hypothetical protein